MMSLALQMWLPLLFMPLCALLAGLLLWTLYRRHTLSDDQLMWHFLSLLLMCGLAVWGISKTHTVRMRIDPDYRLQAELAADPVLMAFKLNAPSQHRKLEYFISTQISEGKSLPQAYAQGRAMLTQLTNERMGFADQKTRIRWAKLHVATLKELQAIDPVLCYRALSYNAPDQATLARTFSDDNTREFTRAVIAVYESSGHYMNHDRSPDDETVEFDDTAREYSHIRDEIEVRFGKPVSDQLANRQFPEKPVGPPEQMCTARIAQLEAMLARRQGIAAMLVDSVLR